MNLLGSCLRPSSCLQSAYAEERENRQYTSGVVGKQRSVVVVVVRDEGGRQGAVDAPGHAVCARQHCRRPIGIFGDVCHIWTTGAKFVPRSICDLCLYRKALFEIEIAAQVEIGAWTWPRLVDCYMTWLIATNGRASSSSSSNLP